MSIFSAPHRRCLLLLAGAPLAFINSGCAQAVPPAATGAARPAPTVSQDYAPYPGDPDGRTERVTVTVDPSEGPLRSFTLRSTAPQRDNGPSERRIAEQADRPSVHSGSLLFDALFALALDDARLDSASSIRDDAYNDGRDIDCNCFQTGEKWPYVWTRDLSYAVDLGLAGIDPARAVNSLLFKTSGFRDGAAIPSTLPAGSTQIIQDTGSGGSWPVSTDRTSWALGAEAVLAQLPDAERAAFAEKAYAALRGTVEADREAAFDPLTGLYGGEHSFLDWREQTYAPWIVDHLAKMSASKGLSTNIVQYRALRLAARLGRERGDAAEATKYDGWADALKSAINDRFWMPEAGLYASLTTADPTAAPIAKFDMLGSALAIISGIADTDRALSVVSRYPHAPYGVPVYFPHQPGMVPYHNRAIWPFVTAYSLKAAARVRNVAVADNAVASLMRGAALHLSNMENLEWLTGKSEHDGGPVINSRRQLWSVGGYIGMVTETLFGYHVDASGVRIDPFLTTSSRRLLGDGNNATLDRLSYRGKPLRILLHLPAAAGGSGYYPVASIRLNGAPSDAQLDLTKLRTEDNLIEVTFGAVRPGEGGITLAPAVPSRSHDDPTVFSPWTPAIAAVRRAGNDIVLDIAPSQGRQKLRYTVLRDGVAVASNVEGPSWRDPHAPDAGLTVCYSVTAVHPESRIQSHPSLDACLRGSLAQTIAVTDARVETSAPLVPASPTLIQPTRLVGRDTSFSIRDINIPKAGTYAFRFAYNNHLFDINTGVTNAVKRLRLVDMKGATTGQAIVQMPHVGPVDGVHPLRESTVAYFTLPKGRYRLDLSDYFNMSYLAVNSVYARPGGTEGPRNEASIAALQIDAVSTPTETAAK